MSISSWKDASLIRQTVSSANAAAIRALLSWDVEFSSIQQTGIKSMTSLLWLRGCQGELCSSATPLNMTRSSYMGKAVTTRVAAGSDITIPGQKMDPVLGGK